jgi:hypothetical protein
MPRNSSGTYSLPAGNPVVTLEVISSSWANTTLGDIATALTGSLSRSGEGSMLAGLELFDGTASAPGLTWGTELTSGWYRNGSNDFRFSIASTDRLSINTTGTVVAGRLSVQSTGILNVAGTKTAPAYSFTLDGDTGIYNKNPGEVAVSCNDTDIATFASNGTVTIHSTLAITTSGTIAGFPIGYNIMPQNIQAGNYTLVLADAGKHIIHEFGAGAGDTYTIPANASVAFTIGTAVTFVNLDSNAITIAITSDTMVLAGTASTGSRTLAQFGMATAVKVSSTTWLISGAGLT